MSSDQIYIDLIDHFGGQVKTGEVLKVGQATVSGWKNNVHSMKPAVAIRAERRSGRKFKAEHLSREYREIKTELELLRIAYG